LQNQIQNQKALLLCVIFSPLKAFFAQIKKEREITIREVENLFGKMLLFTIRIINQLVRGWMKPLPITSTKNAPISYDVAMRCWPIDIDIFMHMNNAMYVRCAELARWRIFPQSSSLRMTSMSGILFLAVDQQVVYHKPIMPFSKYIIRTTISTTDNKWLHYCHTFQQDPSQVKSGQDPKIYAVVNCRAVLKEKSGKTVKIDQIAKSSDFYSRLAEHQQQQDHSTHPGHHK
jgi:acyl-CoA thioesterase FadM